MGSGPSCSVEVASSRAPGNTRASWNCRAYRADRGKPRKPRLAPAPPGLHATARSADIERAAAPAKSAPAPSLRGSACDRGAQPAQETTAIALVSRLAAGRTVQNLLEAMGSRLFVPSTSPSSSGQLVPKKGLFASIDGDDVFVLAVFTRHRVPLADVIPVRPMPGKELFRAKLNETRTCKQAELINVGVHYHAVRRPSDRARTKLVFKRAEPHGETFHESTMRHLAFEHYLGALNAQGTPAEPASVQPVGLPTVEPRQLLPSTLRAHLGVFAARNEPHCAWPRSDEKAVGFVLDLPLPIPFDDRGYVCTTCKNDPRVQHSPVYRLDDDDIRLEFPGALVHRTHRSKAVYMSKRFLVHLVLSFYEVGGRGFPGDLRASLCRLSQCVHWAGVHGRRLSPSRRVAQTCRMTVLLNGLR